jgi:hypothetical protein
MTTPKYEPMNKYTKCVCEKQEIILVGAGIGVYINAIGLVGSAAMTALALGVFLINMSAPLSPAYLLVGFLPFYMFMMKWCYSGYYKHMIKAGHTKACSKKLAWQGMWHQARGSSFQVDVDPSEVDPQGDYGTPTMGLWFLAFFGNLIFLGDFAYGQGTLILYPILFTIVIVGSVRLIRMIKNMTRTVYVFCILNIVSSGLFFLLYLINLLAKLG